MSLQPERRVAHDAPRVVWYNAVINNNNINNPDTPVNAEYIDNRPVPILERPELYNIAVTRFSIPRSAIPLFFFDAVDPNEVALQHVASGDRYQVPLAYQSVSVPVPPANALAIHDITQYLMMANTAFVAAMATLQIAHPGPPLAPPFFTYDPTTALISMNIPAGYSGVIRVFITGDFARLLGRFVGANPITDNTLAPGEANSEFVPRDPITWLPTAAAVAMPQSAIQLRQWDQLRSIQIVSTTVPVDSEYLPAGGPGGNQTQNVLTDFLREPSEGGVDTSPLLYFGAAPLRWYPIAARWPLQTIGLALTYRMNDEIVRPLQTFYTDQVSIKIQFRRNDLDMV